MLLKAQLPKVGQSGGCLGKLLKPSLKTGFLLMKNELKPSTKSALILLGLITAASITDPNIHKKMFGSDTMTLIIYNEDMKNLVYQ